MMKMKKILMITSAAVLALMTATGCQNGSDNSTSQTGNEGKIYDIAVLQYADHPSLDNCRTGFEQGLKEAGIQYTLTTQSARNDDPTNTQIAQNFAAQKKDLVCGIATPSAQALYNACFEAKIPVVFNAVSDPVAANLAKSATETLPGITGVSDKLPVEAQLKLIREVLPDAKKIGILYTTSEQNSVATIQDYESKVKDFGFELVSKGVTNAAEIPQAVDVLLGEVDCITNMTDNTVVTNLPVLLERATAKNIPVFGSEEEQVKNGCIAAAGIDYIELGKKAGLMAARILQGENIAGIPFETMTESAVTINSDAAKAIGLTFPASILESAEDTVAAK